MLGNKSYNSQFTIHKSQVLKIILFFLCIFTYDLTLTTYDLFAQDRFTYDAKGKRDPFIPLVTPDGRLVKLEPEESASGLLLEGIIYDEYGLSCAIVNGQVVSVSDKVGDYQVLRVEKDKVIFIKDGKTTEVELTEKEESLEK